MSVWLSLLLFAIGIFLIVKGGDTFVDAASWIAHAFGIPTFVIGATIVSVATTLPEMLVSVIAASHGQTEMAIGNAVGSVTANTGLILAAAMLFLTMPFARKENALSAFYLIVAAALLWVASMGGILHTWGIVVLLFIFVLFMGYNVRHAARELEENDNKRPEKKQLIINILKFVVGAAAIVLGSDLLVESGTTIAQFFHVPERVIAVTLIAIGTSLPELVTTITAIVKKQSGLSIGNIIGANIIDLTLILPLCSIVSGEKLPVAAGSITLDMPVCLGLILIAMVPLLIRQKNARWQGALLIAGYAGYLVLVL